MRKVITKLAFKSAQIY